MLAFISAFFIGACGIVIWSLKGVINRRLFLWFPLITLLLVLWIIWLAIPIEQISPVIITNWFRLGTLSTAFLFSVTKENWILCFSCITACFTILVTAPLRVNRRYDVDEWIQISFLTAHMLLAVSSQTLWALVAVWVSFDLFVFVKELFSYQENKIKDNYYINQILSWFLLLISAAISKASNEGYLISVIPGISYFFLLLAGFMRLFRRNEFQPDERRFTPRTGLLWEVSRVMISLGWIWQYRFNIELMPDEGLSLIFLIFGIFLVLPSRFMRQAMKFVRLKIFLIICSLFFAFSEFPAGFLAFLSIVVLISGLLDSELDITIPKVVFMAIISFLVSALPFSPYYPEFQKWQLGSSGFSWIFSLMLVIIMAQLMFELINAKLKIPFVSGEFWQRGFSQIVLGIQVISSIAVTLKNISAKEYFKGYWWAGSVTFLLGLIIYLILQKASFVSLLTIVDTVYAKLDAVQKKMQYSKGTIDIIDPIAKTINVINTQLEGNAGLLWSLVILALLVSAIGARVL